MERELHRRLYRIVYDLARATRTKRVRHADRVIVMVYFWAVLNDRPTVWACRRGNWPDKAQGLALPSASTMSRRLRGPEVRALIDRVERLLQEREPRDWQCYIDAKPLVIGNCSGDRDARFGYAAGRVAKGYKMHVILDAKRIVRHWHLDTMKPHESKVAPRLIDQLPGTGTLVGDNAYDKNKLYRRAGRRGWQLVARRRKGTKLGKIKHDPWRLRAHRQMTRAQRQELFRRRGAIERFFGQLGNQPGGLGPLPNHVRGLRRVRLWVQAKLILYHLRMPKLAA
jgi:hypothetical protein